MTARRGRAGGPRAGSPRPGGPRAGGAGRDCARHRLALVDLVADPGVALRPADRAHLDSCAACRTEITELALTAFALRRSLAPIRMMEPSADSLPKLRARVLRQRGARTLGRLASPVLAVLMGAGLAVALLVPYGLPAQRHQVLHEAGIDPAAIRAAGQRDAADEARRMHALVLAGKEDSGPAELSRSRLDLIRYESDEAGLSIDARSPLSAAVQQGTAGQGSPRGLSSGWPVSAGRQ